MSARSRERIVRGLPGAAWACLIAVVFLQAPGLVVADTKLDLTADPAGFLARSLHLWAPQAAFGQLQNQAYGYLFPMGPFFLLGHVLHLPPWVVQRSWQALLLIVAFEGARALARRLDIGSPTTRLIGGFAYALSPFLVSHIGPVSSEALPSCIAPWVLLPLVGQAAAERPRAAAARSGLAFLCAGGVNAAATLAVLVLPVLWLLTAPLGVDAPRQRLRLAANWCVAVVLASLWWALPLIVLGRYSPPFVTWIESAANTTSVTSVLAALLGSSDWLGHLQTSAGPVWPAALTLASASLPLIASSVVTGLGVAGLTLRAVPARRFLAGAVLVGVTLITFGHPGPFSPPVSSAERALLDGPLAAFRNIWKFDPVLRVALVLSFVHVLTEVARWTRERAPALSVRVSAAMRGATVGIVAVASVAAAAAPMWVGGLEPPGAFASIPSYWSQTGAWLALHTRDGGRALLLPASQHPSYDWGLPTDEPLQVLAATPWAVRDAPVLGGAGEARLLDTVDEVIESGQGERGLAAYLARAGVEWLVVRGDLNGSWDNGQVPPRSVVHAAITGSPGLTRVATFGPIEIYSVAGPVSEVTLDPLAGTLAVSGGPESLLEVIDGGILTPATATVMAADPPLAGQPASEDQPVVTDGYRRQEVNVGRASFDLSATLTPSQPWTLARSAHDYYIGDPVGHQTTAVVYGAAGVSASSSAADASTDSIDQAASAVAGFDDDPATFWESGGVQAVGEWIEADFTSARTVPSITIAAPSISPHVRRVTAVVVTTAAGRFDFPVATSPRTYPLPPEPTQLVRVTVAAVQRGGVGSRAALKVSLGGVVVERSLAVPNDVAIGSRPPIFVFASQPAPRGEGDDEDGIDRTFTVASRQRYVIRVTALPNTRASLRAAAAEGSGLVAPCGAGPVFQLDGRSMPSEVRAETGGAVAGSRPQLAVTPCGHAGWSIVLTPGRHRLRLARTSTVTPDQVTMLPVVGGALTNARAPVRSLHVLDWGADARSVRVGPGAGAWLVVRENANPGWQATLAGKALIPAIIDGWQQAFVIPAGSGGVVELEYSPDRLFRDGLLAGAIAALLLVGMAVIPFRRRRGRSGKNGERGRTGTRLAGALFALGALVLIGGTGGILALVAVGAVAAVVRVLGNTAPPRLGVAVSGQTLFVVSGGCVIAAGVWAASVGGKVAGPWGAAGPIQLLCLGALACVALRILDGVVGGRERSAKLTGERPIERATPDSILAIHAAGYRAVVERLGSGRLLDLGCGEGEGSLGLASDDRVVVGVDYALDPLRRASRLSPGSLLVSCMDAGKLGLSSGCFDWVCSSHIIEHFTTPTCHVSEIARVVRAGGTAFFLTPNAPADFENPYHVHLFEADTMSALLSEHFDEVWVGGIDANEKVKQDLDARRRRARRLLAIDFLHLRKRIPRSWLQWTYAHALPVAYRLLARGDTEGKTGITADDFFVTDAVDDTTLVLFAIARSPRRPSRSQLNL